MGDQDYKIPCDENCFHYDTFDGVSGCGQKNGLWGGWPETIEPGQGCLYPQERHICKPVMICSIMGLCAALEGEIIEGGPHDNTQLIRLLVGSDNK